MAQVSLLHGDSPRLSVDGTGILKPKGLARFRLMANSVGGVLLAFWTQASVLLGLTVCKLGERATEASISMD